MQLFINTHSAGSSGRGDLSPGDWRIYALLRGFLPA
jgi:hypothetical protein